MIKIFQCVAMTALAAVAGCDGGGSKPARKVDATAPPGSEQTGPLLLDREDPRSQRGLAKVHPSKDSTPATAPKTKDELVGEWMATLSPSATEDPDSALRTLLAEVPLALRRSVILAVLHNAGKESLSVIPVFLDEVAGADLRRSALQSLAQHWGEREPALLFEFAMGNLAGSERNELLVGAVEGAMRKGKLAVGKDLFAKMPLSNHRLGIVANLANDLARHDPEAALEWGSTLELAEERDRALSTLTDSVAKAQGIEGLERILAVTSNREVRSGCFRAAVPLLAKGGATVMHDWFNGLASEDQESAVTYVIYQSSEDDLPKMSHLVSAMPSMKGRWEATSAYISRLAERSPATTADWVLGLPKDSLNVGLTSLVNTWHRTNPDELTKWMNTLPPGETRDYVLSNLISHAVNTNRELARAYAAEISDPKTRRETEWNLRNREDP